MYFSFQEKTLCILSLLDFLEITVTHKSCDETTYYVRNAADVSVAYWFHSPNHLSY